MVCGHGSTSGQIDEDLLFYLEARGIPEAEARALLIQAFVGEAIELIENEGLRDALDAASADWLGVALRLGAADDHPDTVGKDLSAVQAPYDVEAIRADFPILARKCTASRSSISTTAPRRRSRKPCSTPSSAPMRTNTPTSIAACII